MPQVDRQFVDPAVLSRIVPIGLRATGQVEGPISGLHRSPMHGLSPEFAEYREYSPGDDLKNLDWRVFGRTDRHVIKRFEEESNLRCTLLVDASASMGYANRKTGRTKFQAAATIAACLAVLLMKQRDAVGLVTFDKQVRESLKPSATQKQLNQVLETLGRTEVGGETSLADVLDRVTDRLARRGMVVLLTDLLDDPDRLYKSMGKLKHGGHEVLVVQLLDSDEIELPFDDTVMFKDIEGDEQLHGEPWAFRKAYRDAMGEFVGRAKRECRLRKFDHVLLHTDRDLGPPLAQFLHRRANR
jgi:uncharacterized protein (DUF58 family)